MESSIYTVNAYRWGKKDGDWYPVGVFSTFERALAAAEKEKEERGGKYECEVLQWELDADDSEPDVLLGLPPW